MIQSIVNFVFLISSRTNRENLAQKLRLPYSDGFGVKKNLFSYALQTTLALNTKKLSTYISWEQPKKGAQAPKRFSGPILLSPVPSASKLETPSGNENEHLALSSTCQKVWFPVCGENLYLKVNLFSANALVCVCFFKEKLLNSSNSSEELVHLDKF